MGVVIVGCNLSQQEVSHWLQHVDRYEVSKKRKRKRKKEGKGEVGENKGRREGDKGKRRIMDTITRKLSTRVCISSTKASVGN